MAEETARPAAPTPAAQQRRFDRWRESYNHQRPHEALGMRVPATVYRPSRRRLRPRGPARYPRAWPALRVNAKGRVWWWGRVRVIGRAFSGQRVGLKPAGHGRWRVYLQTHFLGLLVATDLAGLRPVQWRAALRRSGPAQAPARSA